MKRYYHQVYPVNYALLHEDEQESIVEEFKSLLNQLRKEITIICHREAKEIHWEDRVFEADVYSFYIESMERLDELLEASGLLYQPLLNPPPQLLEPSTVSVQPKYIIHGGRVYRVLVAYKLPFMLTEGFIQEVLPLVDELRILIKPINRHYAVRMLKKKHKLRKPNSTRSSNHNTRPSHSSKNINKHGYIGSDISNIPRNSSSFHWQNICVSR